ncbi:tRNA (adenine(58)-N(1))-methyltransferase non-catalytic subunit TRM [Trema orientale]|uniref:tRNA (adenine(58)-N(1))-methyltransferase non-catalytic subunit TRM6 n=1 Tax=Trema orientale TaxID=63057 RepID=A0A2P5FIV9_TREOI|nr:tRNA (adenine(58)-N(1))-methyltransferase non-catalytic subunit TRM [Trema orientale]
MDTSSLLLSMANVSANSDVIVVDMVGGLLTGAVAEQMGCSLHVLFAISLYFAIVKYLSSCKPQHPNQVEDRDERREWSKGWRFSSKRVYDGRRETERE